HIEGLSHVVPEFINVRALRDVFKYGHPDDFDKEHVTPYFRKHQNQFKVESLSASYGGLRSDLDRYLAIDNWEDLERFEVIIKELKLESDNPSDFKRLYDFLDRRFLKVKESTTEDDLTINLNGKVIGDGYPTFII